MSSTTDYFYRKKFADQILSLVKILPTPFSIGIDAPWGSGKTFFVHNVLKLSANEQSVPLVVYDAFEHEKDGDVFISLVTSIVEQVVEVNQADNENNTPIRDAVQSVAKGAASLCKGVLRVGGNTAARLILKQGMDEIASEFSNDEQALAIVSEDMQKSVEKFILERTKPDKSYKVLKNSFKESMKQLIAALSPDGKFLVVIDDLDRCTPKHALEIFEAIHHLLNTPGIIFIFSYHRHQLERMVEHTYGQGIDSTVYLSKFINLNFDLPEPDESLYKEGLRRLASDRYDIFTEKVNGRDPTLHQLMDFLCRFSERDNVSPRLVQEYASAALAAKIHCRKALNMMSNRDLALALLWRLTKPNLLKKITSDEISTEEYVRIGAELGYKRLVKTISTDDSPFDQIFGDNLTGAPLPRHYRESIKEILSLDS